MSILRWLFSLSLAGLAGVGAAEVRLPIEAGEWTRQVRLPEGVSEDEAVTLRVEPCGAGRCLVAGPWWAGSSGARLAFSRPLPFVEATVQGRYRTENLYPRQAVVRVDFLAGEQTLASRSFSLAPAGRWTGFRFPVFRAPSKADSIRISFGLHELTPGRVWFTDLAAAQGYDPPVFPEKPPPLTRPAPPRKLPASRYVRVERHNGAWWMVTPEGRAFFSLGTDAMIPGEADPAHEDRVYRQMRELGFNSLAGWHSVARWSEVNARRVAAGDPPLWQMRSLQSRVGAGYDTVVDASGANPGTPAAQAAKIGGFNHAFPDPFDPRWEAALRRAVRAAAEPVRGKPWFALWFADNEREHRNLHRYVWAPNSARAFGKFLEGRYGAIEKLNAAWKASFASFGALLEAKPDPQVRRGAMYEDFRAFSRELLRRFNQTALRVIREEDPGRLVFSNRFMIGEIRDVADNLDLYADFDGICVNIYPANVQPGLGDAEVELLKLIHERSGKPVLIGEWSVPALDSGLYNNLEKLDWSYPQTVSTQTERARQAAAVVAQLYNLPFIVGSHWFIWNDFDSPVRQANRGLFRASGEPWVELQKALADVQHKINSR